MSGRTWVIACALTVSACASASGPDAKSAPRTTAASIAVAEDAQLVGADGTAETLRTRVARSPYTVLLYFASHCPVQKAHDARIRALAEAYAPRGVTFLGVSTEPEADLPSESAVAKARGLPFPIVADRGAKLARAANVEFSTHALVLDRSARVLYSGGVDTDRSHVTADATPHLKNALDDLLDGKAVRQPVTEALGCPLRLP